MDIKLDDLSGPEIRDLLEEHLRNMRSISPPESVHALDLDGLRRPEITFWTAWSGGDLLGCGALRQIDARHGEARRRNYLRLSLETGSHDAFEPARRLYRSFGFTCCAPFEGYAEDPNSVFMTRLL